MREMKNNRGNALKFVLRRPYKIALCALLNAVLLVFCFIEGGQWLLAGSAIRDARESRVFLGTLAPHMEGRAEDGENPEAVFYVTDPDQGFVEDGVDGRHQGPVEGLRLHMLGDLPHLHRADGPLAGV